MKTTINLAQNKGSKQLISKKGDTVVKASKIPSKDKAKKDTKKFEIKEVDSD
jgi:hypothetical protein